MMDISLINGGTIGSFVPAYESITYSLSMYSIRLNAKDYLSQYKVLLLEPSCLGRTESFGLEPRTGPANAYGEHSCVHDNLKGHMFVVPEELAPYGQSVRCWRPSATDRSLINFTTFGSLTKGAAYGGGYLYTLTQVLYPKVGYSVNHSFVVRTIDGADISYDTLATESYTCVDTWSIGMNQYVMLQYKYVKDRLNASSIEYAYKYKVYVFQYVLTNKFVYTSSWYDSAAAAKSAAVSTYFGRFTTANYTAPPDTFQLPKGKLLAFASQLESYDEYDLYEVYGELANAAVQDAKCIDINSIAFIRDITKLGDVLSTFAGAASKLTAKGLSAAYLAYHYGLRLFISDSKDVVSSLRDQSNKGWTKTWSVVRARSASSFSCIHPSINGGTVKVESCYKIRYSQVTDIYTSLLKFLDDWDLAFNAGNVWDLIPFSFVVDWFINIGEMLEADDNRRYLHRLPVLGTVRSRKCEFPPFDNLLFSKLLGLNFHVAGNYHFVRYERILSSSVIYPRVGMNTEWSIGNHVVEAIALLVQKAR